MRFDFFFNLLNYYGQSDDLQLHRLVLNAIEHSAFADHIITLSSNEGSGESTRQSFTACINKVWMLIKIQTKIQTSSHTGYISTVVYARLLRICDKY